MAWRRWVGALPNVPQVNELLEAKFWREAVRSRPETHIAAVRDIEECGAQLRDRLLAFGTCPPLDELGAFDRAVVELTLGAGEYETMSRTIDPTLARRATEVARGMASRLPRVKRDLFTGRRDAVDFLRDVVGSGKGCRDIEALRVAMRTLRALPTIEDGLPTVALVGMPNVGKSSIVRLLSTGKPQVNVYPFTTRGLLVGHLVGEGGAVPMAGTGGGTNRRPAAWRAQVMDTPGLLWRPEHREGPDYRNPIEQLTMLLLNHLASPSASPSGSGSEQAASGSGGVCGGEGEALWLEEHLHPQPQRREQQPLVVLFVVDPSEQCGFPLDDQLALRAHLRENFAARLARPGAGHLWIDVSNKTDLGHGWRALDDANARYAAASVSASSGEGIPQLRALIESHGMRHSS